MNDTYQEWEIKKRQPYLCINVYVFTFDWLVFWLELLIIVASVSNELP